MRFLVPLGHYPKAGVRPTAMFLNPVTITMKLLRMIMLEWKLIASLSRIIEETEGFSRTLGEEDSDSSSDVGKKTLDRNETPVKKVENKKHPQTKKTWASLFSGNNQRSEDTSLQKVEVGEGPVKLLVEDVEAAASRWEHSLVG